MTDLLSLSDGLAALTAKAGLRTVAVSTPDGRTISGFLWSSGLVVTADEALGLDDEVTVLTAAGQVTTAQLVGRDPSTDIALLHLDPADVPAWDEAPTPAPGSLVLLVGRTEVSTLSGLAWVSEAGGPWRSMRGGEIDARISLGPGLNSSAEGSAVVAPQGALVGMAVAGPRGRTLVIPTVTIRRAVATLVERGYVPRAWLGLSLRPIGKGGGAIVVGVGADSPAADGGFLVGDIITTWDGKLISSVGEVAAQLSASQVGQSTRLGVMRSGSALELDVVIGERPRS